MRKSSSLFLVVVLSCAPVDQKKKESESEKVVGCGEPPELSYVCAGGVYPCECITDGSGIPRWRCTDCPAALDCTKTPSDPMCVEDRSCIGCHGLASGPTAQGIENAHPWSYIGCVACHGGLGKDPANPNRSLTKEEAHVSMPKEMSQGGSSTTPTRTVYKNYYLARAGVEKFQGGVDWLRFENPGDLRVVDKTCAKSGCHEGSGEKVRRSVMATVTGKLDAMPYAAGMPRAADLIAKLGSDSTGKRLATYGAAHVDDPTWSAATAPPGSVPHLHPLLFADRDTEKPYGTFTEQDIFNETINKLCGTCHLGHNGTNDKFGKFRSSGCTACHMSYDWSGQSQSGDPMISKAEPTYPEAYTEIRYPERPHASRHQLKRNLTAQECLACHTGSARSVFEFMGLRTDDNRDLTRTKTGGGNLQFTFSNLIDNRRVAGARLHGLAQDQLIEFEDLDEDGRDDTPADVHYQAGLECVDCHPATDMHGDGRIYSRQNQAVKVRCVHCHGTLEYTADPDAKSNLINEIFHATKKLERKNLWKFDRIPSRGETGYPAVTAAGLWLRTKTRGEWRYVPQVRWGVQWDPAQQDCFGDGRRIDPRNGQFACTPTASIAHGRWQGTNAGAGDFDDGVGPRPGTEVTVGADGNSSAVRYGFSHLGEPAPAPNLEPAGGLECTSCHATWHNMRYGNHLGLKDMDANGNRLYDWDRITGRNTLGTQGHFDFSFVSLTDLQLGVNAKGKIAYFLPTRLKMFVRQQVLDPSTQKLTEFMKQVGDPNHIWKTYRDRVGFGNLVQGQSGLTRAPGYSQVCLEPGGYCDQDANKNINGGLGSDTSAPHTTQRRARDCGACHVQADGAGANLVSAVYGWNPQGFTAQTSAYLKKIPQVVTSHGTYDTSGGFTIADDGIRHKLDHLVDEQTGYPLVYTLHVRTDDGRDGRPSKGYPTYDPKAAGPITKPLIEKLKKVRVNNLYK